MAILADGGGEKTKPNEADLKIPQRIAWLTDSPIANHSAPKDMPVMP